MIGAIDPYTTWMLEVDLVLARRCGMTSSDLADTNTRDNFDGGTTPEDMAELILENEGFDSYLEEED